MVDANGKPIIQQFLNNDLIKTELLLPDGETTAMDECIRQDVEESSRVIGNHNGNTLLKKLLCECDFPDGTTKEYAANMISENVLS